jgi:hypothetical protein
MKQPNEVYIRPMERDDRRRKLIPTDRNLMEKCVQLRHRVEHPNEVSDIILQNGVYRQKDPEAILTIRVDGVEVGYKVKECSKLEMNPYFDRYVYLKVLDYKLWELTNKQLASIKTALYNAFLEPQQGKIHVKIISDDAMVMVQRFQVAFWYQKSPDLVSIAGGVDTDADGKIITKESYNPEGVIIQ